MKSILPGIKFVSVVCRSFFGLIILWEVSQHGTYIVMFFKTMVFKHIILIVIKRKKT